MGVKVKLTFFTPQVMRAIKDGAAKQMVEAVNEVRNQTLKTLSGSRTGRQYFVPGTRKLYTASSPGEPPAVATSALKQSIKYLITSKGGKTIGEVGTDLKKGKMLEFGTRKMKPRPWLRISFLKVEKKLKDILGGRWFR